MTTEEMLQILSGQFGGDSYINQLLNQINTLQGTRGPVDNWGTPAQGGYMDQLAQSVLGLQGTRGPVAGWGNPELTEAFAYLDQLAAPSQQSTQQSGTQKWAPQSGVYPPPPKTSDRPFGPGGALPQDTTKPVGPGGTLPPEPQLWKTQATPGVLRTSDQPLLKKIRELEQTRGTSRRTWDQDDPYLVKLRRWREMRGGINQGIY